MILADDNREEVAQATVESTWSKSVTEESAKCQVEASHQSRECANFRWSAHSVGKGANKVKDDVSSTLMAVSGDATEATKTEGLKH